MHFGVLIFYGTFLNSRNFLSYHPKERFRDASLFILKNNQVHIEHDKDAIVAVIPASEIIQEDDKKLFFSHKGSTFGGIIISEKYFNVDYIDGVIKEFNKYIEQKKYDEVYLKQVPSIFNNSLVDTLDYLLQNNNYNSYEELSIVVDLLKLNDILMDFAKTTRKNCNRGIKTLNFKEIIEEDEILEFHRILTKNLAKHDVEPIHKSEELIDLKERLDENIKFFGAFKDDLMVGGNMSFLFKNRVFHTQNTSIDYEFSNLRPADFINYNLIKLSKQLGFKYYSFGICTENQGQTLNFSLAKFKERYCGEGSINKTYYRIY